LNPSFCELTGLYWAWKNLDADYVGLAHYRRHFKGAGKASGAEASDVASYQNPLFAKVLNEKDLELLLGKGYRVFVPGKRRYYIESLYSHYAHTHYASQLDDTRKIIEELYPAYVPNYDKVVKQTWGYMFNMMILPKDLLKDYCQWLFDILFRLKEQYESETAKQEENQQLSAFQGRFYGRISEIIFNVWLQHQVETGRIRKEEVKELPLMHMEDINWWKKGTAFLKAKFGHKRYEGSF